MPQGGEFNPYPIARRVNSSHTVVMDDDIESASLGVYQDRPRTFPDMRSKVNTPLVSSLSLSILIPLYVDTFSAGLQNVII